MATNPDARSDAATTPCAIINNNKKGSSSSSSSTQWVSLLGAIVVWYGASAVANTSSKQIMAVWPAPVLLSLTQACIASMCGAAAVWVAGMGQWRAMDSDTRHTIIKIAAVYTLGFLCINTGFVFVDVSLAETLRAGEPLFSAALAWLLLAQPPSPLTCGALVVTAAGIGMAAASSTTLNPLGVVFSGAANCLFSLRSVWTKHLQHRGTHSLPEQDQQQEPVPVPVDGWCLFLCVSSIGAVLTAAIQLGCVVLLGSATAWPDTTASHVSAAGHTATSAGNATEGLPVTMLAVNGVAYFLYNQMSFVVLSRVHILTHAVANGCRRLFTIIAAVLYFAHQPSLVNWIGMCTVCTRFRGQAQCQPLTSAMLVTLFLAQASIGVLLYAKSRK